MVHTKNRGGSKLNKSFTVFTNDPKKSRLNLTVVGQVKAYVKYSPKYIRFTGKVGQELTQSINVIPFKEFPFRIKKVTAKEGKHLRYELSDLPRKEGPQGYKLVVYNTMTTEGSYRDTITLQTDSKVKPELKIPVSGRIRRAVPKTHQRNPK